MGGPNHGPCAYCVRTGIKYSLLEMRVTAMERLAGTPVWHWRKRRQLRQRLAYLKTISRRFGQDPGGKQRGQGGDGGPNYVGPALREDDGQLQPGDLSAPSCGGECPVQAHPGDLSGAL